MTFSVLGSVNQRRPMLRVVRSGLAIHRPIRRWPNIRHLAGNAWVSPDARVGPDPTSGEALKLYGQDLTKQARDGKLDPVIGRDGVVRRTLQVLARRTKNNPVLIGAFKNFVYSPDIIDCVVSR